MPLTKAATTVLCEPAQSKWKWTDRRNHFTRDSEVKCRRPRLRQPFCASLPSRNAHRHVTRDILCESCQGKCRRRRSRKIRGAGFVLACAVEMRMDMSQEKFYVRICRKKTANSWSTLIKDRPLLLPKNPSVWTTNNCNQTINQP
jgi:hypothetical protein